MADTHDVVTHMYADDTQLCNNNNDNNSTSVSRPISQYGVPGRTGRILNGTKSGQNLSNN